MPGAVFGSMYPVRIRPVRGITTKAGETCVSIVRPTNAPTWILCGSFLLCFFQAYTTLDLERIEAKTRWTADRAEVDTPRSPAIARPPCPASRLWPIAILWCSPCGCGASVCLSYLPWEEGNAFQLCYPIYATSGCCVTDTDSPVGEMQDCHRTMVNVTTHLDHRHRVPLCRKIY